MFRARSPRSRVPARSPRLPAGLSAAALLVGVACVPLLSGCAEERRAETMEAAADMDAVAPASGPAPLAARPRSVTRNSFVAGARAAGSEERYGRVSRGGEEESEMIADAFEADFDMADEFGVAEKPSDLPIFESVEAEPALPFAPPEPADEAPDALEGQRDAGRDFNTEEYARVPENRFLSAQDTPLSTFAVDVDTASYANVRRFLTRGQLPPPGAVRIEELVNYFRYDYEPPTGVEGGEEEEPRPFAVHAEVAACPWEPTHRLVRIGLKGREIEADARPLCNLVFLLDVSGSMNSEDKLGLVKRSMTMLTEQLGENDTVSIVVYAGASGLALPATSGDDPRAITAALDRLAAGGSTNGGQGIELAYRTAVENYIEGGVNRVILCTDGDFNIGVTDDSSLVRLIEQKAKAGVALTVLGFGTGNYQDAKMEQLADHGDGNFGYIDTIGEAKKLLVEQLAGTLVTIAKDVKVQVEFNPAAVRSYRLIGYENRLMAAEDFRDDAKDAGEIGAGHTVTALYEVVPTSEDEPDPEVAGLKYQTPGEPTAAAAESGELLTVALRYKAPGATKEDPATEFNVPVPDAMTAFGEAGADYRFAAAVAAFGMLLRGSEHAGTAKMGDVAAWAAAAAGHDPDDYRTEFVDLTERAARLGD